MKNLFKLLLATAMMSSNLISVAKTDSAVIPGSQYVIKQIEGAMGDSIPRLQNAYADEQGGGRYSNETSFVEFIEANDNYMMKILLHKTSGDVSRQLKGKRIIVMPEIEDGVGHITTFHCITDMDFNYKAHNADPGTPVGKLSRMKYVATMPMFKQCKYYTPEQVDQLWETGTLSDPNV